MKKESKNTAFVFGRTNYIFLLIGLGLNVLGFLLMIGGGAASLNDFNGAELFSTMRITVAPILILLGYAVILYAIMMKNKKAKEAKDATPKK